MKKFFENIPGRTQFEDRQEVIKQSLLYNLSENAKEIQFEFKQNDESKNLQE